MRPNEHGDSWLFAAPRELGCQQRKADAAKIASDTTLLVNNAGTASHSGLLDGPIDEIRTHMESHYFGTLSVTRAFAPLLIANAPAAVLNIASVLSWPSLLVRMISVPTR